MADELQVSGQINLVEIVSTLGHVVQELARLGEVVAAEGRDTRTQFSAMTREVQECKSELKSEIAALDKAQALTDKELKFYVAKVSAIVSGAVAIAVWILKSGILAALL